MTGAWTISGPLEPDRLCRALDRIHARHIGLREVVVGAVEAPRLAVLPADGRFPIAKIDLLAADSAQLEESTRRVVGDLARHGFDLDDGPLVRAALVRRAEHDHVLAVAFHPLVCDRGSFAVFVRELSALYRDPTADCASVPDALTAQQALSLATTAEDRERDLAYWRQTLAGVGPRTAAPTDRPRPQHLRHTGGRTRLPLHPGWYERVRATARRSDSSVFDVLVTSVSIVLWRFGGDPDVLIATSVDLRAAAGAGDAIGLFAKTLPLRLTIDPARPGRDLIGLARDRVVGAIAHAGVAYDDMVTAVRDDEGDALPEVSVAIELHDDPPLDLPGARVESVDPGTAHTDLTFSLARGPDRASYLEFSTELFDRETADSLATALGVVLTALHDHLDRPVTELALRPVRDTESTAMQPPVAGQPPAVSLVDAVRVRARRHPNRPAVVADEQLTYAELVTASDVLATRLRRAGVQPGSRVGVCLPQSTAQIVTLFGVWSAGAVAVPLDPDLPANRLRSMVRAAGIRTVVIPDDTVGPTAFMDLSRLWVHGEDVQPETPIEVPAQAIAYVMFTSGTSGDPKPVAVTHENLAAFGRAMDEWIFHRLPDPTKVAVTAPMFFDASLQNMQLLRTGHTIHPVPELVRIDPIAFLDFLVEHDIEIADCTPTFAAALVQAGVSEHGRTPLRCLIVGGELIPPDLWECLRRGHIDCYNAYGPTEFTVNATGCSIDEAHPVIGRPLAGVTVEILDARLRPVPIGFPGELYLSGPQLALGYLGRSVRTAERFVAGPNGQRRYATGDIGRWRANGSIEFWGRADSQVKLRGYRIDLSEVASVLRRAPGVVDAAAVVVRRPLPTLAAGLVITDPDTSVEGVRAFAAEQLPAYMVPATLRVLDAVPWTPNGKLDYRALTTALAASSTDAAPSNLPASDVRRRLAQLWCRVLRRTQVDAGDDFFALGGNSLMATWLVRAIDSEFEIELSLQTIIGAPTLSAMSTALEAARGRHDHDRGALVVPLTEQTAGVPLVVIHPLGGNLTAYESLLRLLDGRSRVWGIRSPGDARTGAEPSDVAELARRYSDELLDRLPVPTMALFGWSLGGLAALAVAQELEARGVEISFVEMWDCGLDTSNPLSVREDLVPMAVRAAYGEELATQVTSLVHELPPDLDRDDPSARALVARVCGRQRPSTDLHAFDQHFSIITRQTELFRAWLPSRIRAPLHVVLAKSIVQPGWSMHHTVWDPYTAAGWTQDVVDSDHYGMMRFPMITRTARGLLGRLRALRLIESQTAPQPLRAGRITPSPAPALRVDRVGGW